MAPSLYQKYVNTNTKGKLVLYVKLEKAVYGMMKSTLLFYRKLVVDLISLCYTINSYDPCVANKEINGSHMTICWHVDNLFIGHKDPALLLFSTGLPTDMILRTKSSMLHAVPSMTTWE